MSVSHHSIFLFLAFGADEDFCDVDLGPGAALTKMDALESSDVSSVNLRLLLANQSQSESSTQKKELKSQWSKQN